MNMSPVLTHELALAIHQERSQGRTEAMIAGTNPGVNSSLRRVAGSLLISLGEWLSGTHTMVSAGAQ